MRKRVLNVISVDQKKAFDSVSHKYLFKLISHLSLGEFIFENIKRLYALSFASVNVNRMQSKNYNIKSGIIQGSRLSKMHYVLVFEELLLRIESN